MESTSIPFRSHAALLLAAALPHLTPALTHQAELALKTLELLETLKFYRDVPWSDEAISGSSHNLEKESGIFGLFKRFIQDPEGLLQKLSGICTGKELDLVRMLLNILRAKSFYDTYGDALQMFLSSAMPEDFMQTSTQEKTPDPENPQNPEEHPHTSANAFMPDAAVSALSGGNFASMLSSEQKETLDFLKSLLENET